MKDEVINPMHSQSTRVKSQLDAGVLSELLACDGHLFIRRAYWVLLGREPDPDGLANYIQELRSGASKRRILRDLAQSPEGEARGAPLLGPLMDAINITWNQDITWDQLQEKRGPAFLTCAYQALLGRDPDSDGQRTYLTQLRSGVPRIQVLAQLLDSEEYKAHWQGRHTSILARRIDLEVRKFQLSQMPLLGPLLRTPLSIEGDSPRDRRLRRIEFLLIELGQRDGTSVPSSAFEVD